MKRAIVIILSIILITSTFTGCEEAEAIYDESKVSEDVIAANGEFAFNIFKTLNNEDSEESIFISPLSISTALTMTYNGAETTTKDIMSQSLGYNDTEREVINQSYNSLLSYLQNADKKVDLNIANSIWIREGKSVKEDFLSNNENNFNAEIETLDFSKSSAADTINQWISDATNEKIDKMLESPIRPDVIMYLINAIYFKGEWSEQFDSDDTRDEPFTTMEGEEQTISMMSRKGDIEYVKGEDYKAVRLPYGNEKTSMYCVLPDEGISINDYIDAMTFETWKNIRDNVSEVEDVQLKLPKFELEYGIKNLNDTLISLGMGEAFTDRADFSGIMEGIYISRVLHKAVIEVNEEGSEAAAATVVEMTEAAAMEPITFIADRPFVFIIADDSSETILFMGKLLNVNE